MWQLHRLRFESWPCDSPGLLNAIVPLLPGVQISPLSLMLCVTPSLGSFLHHKRGTGTGDDFIGPASKCPLCIKVCPGIEAKLSVPHQYRLQCVP